MFLLDRGMDKEDVVHTYNGILLSHKKEWNIDIFINIDEAQNNYPEWKKPDKIAYIPSDSIYVKS